MCVNTDDIMAIISYLEVVLVASHFVPHNFEVPVERTGNGFVLRKLTAADAAKDYEAVMSSKESLRTIFAPSDEWPRDDMTLEDNEADLVMHEREFDERKSFAYTVLASDESRCIGCLYLYPVTSRSDYDCQVFYWLIDDIAPEIRTQFEAFVVEWTNDVWPFTRIAFPGRSISWNDWVGR